DNKIIPAGKDGAQPTSFSAGEQSEVFSLSFNPGESVSWTLDGTTVMADENTEWCEEPDPVVPEVICVKENKDESYTVTFGYNNPNDFPVDIPLGNDNKIEPNGYDGSQPTQFAPGENDDAFQITFGANETVNWSLAGAQVSASSQSELCPKPVRPILECVVPNEDGTFTAQFGYLNENDYEVTIEYGDRNKMTPNKYQDQQPKTFKPGRSDYWPNASFSIVFEANETLVWSLDGRTSTVSSNSAPCAYHLFFDKQWVLDQANLDELPDDLPEDYKIIAESDYGTAVCTYDENTQQLVCVYENKKPANNNDGLWVPANGSYTVKEENLPDGWSPLFGTGTFKVGDGYAKHIKEKPEKYLVHTVINAKETEEALEIEPFLICVKFLGDGQVRARFGFYNPNDKTLNIPVGPNNTFSNSDYNHLLPEVFPPSSNNNNNVAAARQAILNQKQGITSTSALPQGFDPENYDGPVIEVIFPEDEQLYWSLQGPGVEEPSETKVATKEDLTCFDEDVCITGYVYQNGEPLANAVVKVVIPGLESTKTVTDEYGYYKVSGVVTETPYQIMVEGYESEALELVVQEDANGCEQVDLSLGGCRPVYAWYQGWYGDQDPQEGLRKWIQESDGGVIDSALFDFYSSRDYNIWEYHILLAWAAEIDAFVVDWYGKDSYETSPMKGLLDAAYSLYERFGHYGFDFRIVTSVHEDAEGTLNENLMFLADSILDHPAYFNQREGKPRPVFVQSLMQKLSPAAFRSAADMYLPSDIWIVWNWDTKQMDLKDYVDGVYPWIMATDNQWDPNGMEWGEDYLETFYQTYQEVAPFAAGATWPGFDDREYVLGNNHYMDRQDTLVYEWTWDKAFDYQPDWLMVETWNDFNRSTHVEVSDSNDYQFVRMTRDLAQEYKGGCIRDINNLGLTVPEHVFLARKAGKDSLVIEKALQSFFMRNYDQALAMLAINDKEQSEFTDRSDALHPVAGSETYAKGRDVRNWQNAVDGDLDGWDGTTWARGNGSESAYAIFEFADKGLYQFNMMAVTTDNGSTDDSSPYPYQTTRLNVSVSTTGMSETDFVNIGSYTLRGTGEREWLKLGRMVRVKYIKIELVSPDYYPGGWRQLVEFELHTDAKQGPEPATHSQAIAAVPGEFGLDQNYPNPFNPETTIRYTVGTDTHVRLSIYDITGREVAVLVDGFQQAGAYTVQWRAMDMPSGMYMLRFTADTYSEIKRMTLLK
ncbi:T9SS type A sorting domain-containing protein, partial [candidate division KSB1 bacterium]|nr:T9SS type A sorting domain-containing protein [candidate division KSB1 bacterium]